MRAIMVPLSRGSDWQLLSEAAATLTAKFKADVTGLFVRRDPKSAIPLLGEGLTADMIQQMCDATETEGLRFAGEAEAVFTSAMEAASVSLSSENTAGGAHWRVVAGDIIDHVGRNARTADFSICERPAEKFSAQSEIFNDLVFRSGRSVLMVPQAASTPSLDHVLVAWNGRAECARAVGGALPILRKAKSVSILQVGDLGEDRPPLEHIARYLTIHGIQSTHIHEPAGSLSVGEAVYQKAQDIGADSIVIGAFSTARWRELILGGVTRYLIENSDIAIYMSH